jgi:hypothetical protein
MGRLAFWAGWLWILGLVLMLITSHRWQIVGSRRHTPWVMGGAVCGWVLLFALCTRRLWPVLGWKEFLVAQIFSALGIFYWLDVGFRLVNCGLDRSPASRETTPILRYGQRKAERYVQVEPPSVGAPIEILIPRQVYETISEGMLAEITLYPGALGDPWCGANAVRPMKR